MRKKNKTNKLSWSFNIFSCKIDINKENIFISISLFSTRLLIYAAFFYLKDLFNFFTIFCTRSQFYFKFKQSEIFHVCFRFHLNNVFITNAKDLFYNRVFDEGTHRCTLLLSLEFHSVKNTFNYFKNTYSSRRYAKRKLLKFLFIGKFKIKFSIGKGYLDLNVYYIKLWVYDAFFYRTVYFKIYIYTDEKNFCLIRLKVLITWNISQFELNACCIWNKLNV